MMEKKRWKKPKLKVLKAAPLKQAMKTNKKTKKNEIIKNYCETF